jgi:hypothetical protein
MTKKYFFLNLDKNGIKTLKFASRRRCKGPESKEKIFKTIVKKNVNLACKELD